MLKIDIHTHILPKDIPNWKNQFGYGGFIQLQHQDACCAKMLKDDGTFFRTIEHNCWDPSVRVKECTEMKVHVQVLSTVPIMFNYWAQAKDTLVTSQFLNDHIADIVAKNPKKFVGLGTLPMQNPDLAVKELHRCIFDLGLRGVQIGTNINGKNLDAKEFFPFFAEVEKMGACIFIHPWDMLAPERMKNYWMPWLVGMPTEITLAISSLIFGGVLEKLPKLRIAFAHGGGSFPGTYARIEHGFQARPDLVAIENPHSPKKYLNKIYVDSLVHDPETLKFLLNFFGERQIALGSDYPFPLGESKAGHMIEKMQDLTELTKQRLFSGTALEWLGMKQEDFI